MIALMRKWINDFVIGILSETANEVSSDNKNNFIELGTQMRRQFTGRWGDGRECAAIKDLYV